MTLGSRWHEVVREPLSIDGCQKKERRHVVHWGQRGEPCYMPHGLTCSPYLSCLLTQNQVGMPIPHSRCLVFAWMILLLRFAHRRSMAWVQILLNLSPLLWCCLCTLLFCSSMCPYLLSCLLSRFDGFHDWKRRLLHFIPFWSSADKAAIEVWFARKSGSWKFYSDCKTGVWQKIFPVSMSWKAKSKSFLFLSFFFIYRESQISLNLAAPCKIFGCLCSRLWASFQHWKSLRNFPNELKWWVPDQIQQQSSWII